MVLVFGVPGFIVFVNLMFVCWTRIAFLVCCMVNCFVFSVGVWFISSIGLWVFHDVNGYHVGADACFGYSTMLLIDLGLALVRCVVV